MKKQLLKPTLFLTGAVAATLLSGCASTNLGYTDVNGPRSAIAYTTVTDPNQLIKWTGDKYLQFALRSIDTYYFQVPDTGYGSPVTTATAPDVTVTAPNATVTAPGVVVTAPDGTVQNAV